VLRKFQFAISAVLLACCFSLARAQQEETPPPAPPTQNAGQVPPQTQSAQTGTTQGEQPTPEATEMPPTSAGITLEPGSQGSTISYLLPSFTWTGFFDRIVSQNSDQTGTLSRSLYIGNVTLQQVRRSSQLNLDAAAGLQFYGRPYLTNTKLTPPGYASLERFSVAETIRRRSLELTLSDEFTYLPESAFGFAGFGGLQSFGGGSGGAFLGNQILLNQFLSPQESLYNGSVGRYVELGLMELRYTPNYKSSFSATGDLGVVNFTAPGYVNTHLGSFYGGYDRRLTSHDQVSVLVLDSEYSFPGQGAGRSVVNRGILLGYTRQVTSRLMVSFTAGPSRLDIAQSGRTITEPLFLTNDYLNYRSRVVNLTARFTQYSNSGSGVFHGAQTDLFTVTAGRRVIKKLEGSLDFGHSYNQGLRGRSATPGVYESWQAGFHLSREFRERTSIYVMYQYQYQTGSTNPCSNSLGCSSVFVRQLIGGGINWHGRPRRI